MVSASTALRQELGVRPTSVPFGAGVQRILVVDDSRMQRRLLRALLEPLGFAVTEASSGEEGLDLCKSHPPDLVISDWVMPGLTGIEFCRALRALGTPSYVYFILLTSKSEKADVAQGLDVGADDFLTKPVNGDELRARIAAGERLLRVERELIEKNRLLGATLSQMQRLHDLIDKDLIEARKLQQSLIKDRYRHFGTGQVSLLFRPSGHVGGDLVGFFPINVRRIGMFALDVSGHGIASALMTARLAGYLSGATPDHNLALVETGPGAQDGRDPAEFAALLNRAVIDQMPSDSYFTLAYADVDLSTGKVALVQAGHPHPAVIRAGGDVEFVGDGGLPLGLFAEAEFERSEVQLSPGDRLFLMSDGMTEIQDSDGHQLGQEGLSNLLSRRAGAVGPAYLEQIVWDLAAQAEDEFSDDVSGALFEYFGPGPYDTISR